MVAQQRQPTFIIAEAGVNHNGDLAMALQLVDVAAQAGADAVKFQTFSAEKLTRRGAEKAEYQKNATGAGDQFDMLKALGMSEEMHNRVLERCHGRVPVIHLKDKEVVAEGPVMAPIGEGNMDWAHIVPACEAAGVRWYCVEQDTCRRDPFDCLQSSFAYLAGLGL